MADPVKDAADAQPMLDAAHSAGLRYADPSEPGISRVRHGRGFTYRDAAGRRLTSAADIERIRAIAIPPAWRDVWICSSARGHIQAMGTDARGRRQYRYHQSWTKTRHAAKFERSIAFARALPRLRRRVARDLRRPGMPREKVLAAVVRLLDRTLLRVGNERYARDNNSFGLTTLRNRHARPDGRGGLLLSFRGKSGKFHEAELRDRRLVRIIRACQDLPGQRLLGYRDESGQERPIESADVNDYIRDATGEEFSAKDFRTWAATVLAAREMQHSDDVPAAVRAVAAQLGNTPAVCRNSYINPAVLADGDRRHARAAPVPTRPSGLSADERRVLAVLCRRVNSAPRGAPRGA
ncbi:MAG TPA: DNA topoisomerase IB [Candidatus Limnocylindria bacterium]|nr:DNA topoisomerase IB [Candidatus Limnocylindria bacterium]